MYTSNKACNQLNKLKNENLPKEESPLTNFEHLLQLEK